VPMRVQRAVTNGCSSRTVSSRRSIAASSPSVPDGSTSQLQCACVAALRTFIGPMAKRHPRAVPPDERVSRAISRSWSWPAVMGGHQHSRTAGATQKLSPLAASRPPQRCCPVRCRARCRHHRNREQHDRHRLASTPRPKDDDPGVDEARWFSVNEVRRHMLAARGRCSAFLPRSGAARPRRAFKRVQLRR
jgi:hypothetical protein